MSSSIFWNILDRVSLVALYNRRTVSLSSVEVGDDSVSESRLHALLHCAQNVRTARGSSVVEISTKKTEVGGGVYNGGKTLCVLQRPSWPANQWPFLRVLSAIGRRMAQQRWPMADDPRLFTDFTLALEPLVAGSSLRTTDWSAMRGHFEKGVPTKWYTFLPLFQRERVFIWFEIYLGPRALTPR